jgi:hypothetical protein
MKTQLLKAKTKNWTITNAKGEVHILPLAIVYTKSTLDGQQVIVFALIFFAWQFRIGWIKKNKEI